MGLHQTDTNQELYNVGNCLGVRWLGLCTFWAKLLAVPRVLPFVFRWFFAGENEDRKIGKYMV